jgi:nitrogen fixation protein
MTIKVTYNVTDVYVTQDVSPVYINVSYSGGGSGGAAVWGGITGTLSDQTDLQSALNLKVPYTGATTNVNLGEYEIKAGQLTLDTSPTGTAAVGTTRWNDTIGSSETTLKGGSVILKNGVDLVARVVNKVSPNTTLTKAAYQAVRVSGAQGQRLAVELAQANNDANSADTIGLVTETIATNQEGFILTVGHIENINTTGSLQGETWADGDVLYLSGTTAGRITNVQPSAPIHIVVVGYVEYAHANNGKIYVKVMNGWELNELHNVSITSVANNEALIYESATALWKNKSIATALGYTPANSATTLTINGVTFDLSTSRTFTVGSVTGSGASGQVAYWTGTSAQSGDAGLTWDSTNKRLSINTSGQAYTISTFYPTGSQGLNIWIGRGGNSSSFTSGLTGSYNTSLGADALFSNTTGFQNTACGTNALYTNNTGNYNSAFGVNALVSNTTGSQNNAFGFNTLTSNTTGSSNMGFGINALRNTTTGGQNVGIGSGAGWNSGTNANTTGNNNIFIGFNAIGVSATESNRTWIGNTSTTSTWLGGNLLLGSTTNSGERLQVTGTMKVTGNVNIGDGSTSTILANSSVVSTFNSLFLQASAANTNTQLDIRPSGTGAELSGILLRDSSTGATGSNVMIIGRGNAVFPSAGVSYIGNIVAGNATGTSFHLGFLVSNSTLGRFEAMRMFNSGNAIFQSGGTYTDIASALVQMTSTTKGFLPPRMTTTQKNAISSPAAGLVVYDTTDNKHYGYDGTTWNAFY